MAVEMVDILALSSFPIKLFWTIGMNCASKEPVVPKTNIMTKMLAARYEAEVAKELKINLRIVE